jgi:hypothetical protein
MATITERKRVVVRIIRVLSLHLGGLGVQTDPSSCPRRTDYRTDEVSHIFEVDRIYNSDGSRIAVSLNLKG